MNALSANDVTLAYGGNTVVLRPSLRAATILERLHNGFPNLLVKLQQTDTATIKAVLLHSATNRQKAHRLLSDLASEPLNVFQDITIGPALDLVSALLIAADQDDQSQSKPTSKPIAWSDLYAELFQTATGWLGWSPQTAWDATIPEIISAFDGHIASLKAIHGAPDEDDQGTTPEQRQANLEAGLDPEFDRSGLHSLRGLAKAA